MTNTETKIANLKKLQSASIVKAVWANSTIEYGERLAIAELYKRLVKLV